MSGPTPAHPGRRTILFILAFVACLGCALYAEYYAIIFAWVRASGYLASIEKQELLERQYHEWGIGFLVAVALLALVLIRGTRGFRLPRRLRPLLAVLSAVLFVTFGYLHSSHWGENFDGHLAHFASSDHGWGETLPISDLATGEQIVIESIYDACDGPGDGWQFAFARAPEGIRFTARDGELIRNPKLRPWLQPVAVFFPKIVRGEISDYMALQPGAEVGSLVLSPKDKVGLDHALAVLRRHEHRFSTGYTTYRFTYLRNGRPIGEERFIAPNAFDTVMAFAEEGHFNNPDFAPDEAKLAHELGVAVAVLRQIVTLEMLDRRLRPQPAPDPSAEN